MYYKNIRLIQELLDNCLKRQVHSWPLITGINAHSNQPIGEVYYLNLCFLNLLF